MGMSLYIARCRDGRFFRRHRYSSESSPSRSPRSLRDSQLKSKIAPSGNYIYIYIYIHIYARTDIGRSFRRSRLTTQVKDRAFRDLMAYIPIYEYKVLHIVDELLGDRDSRLKSKIAPLVD